MGIDWTEHTFGRRPWFLCPACNRRCGRLYTPAWRCRTCTGLRYRIERERPSAGPLRVHRRHLTTARSIRRRLGQPNGWVGAELPDRPRYMRHAVFYQLIEELREHERAAIAYLKDRFPLDAA